MAISLMSILGCFNKSGATKATVDAVMKSEVKMGKVVGVDIRTAGEIERNPSPGSIHIEMSDIGEEFEKKFPVKSQEILIFCESGGRASRVLEFLKSKGYTGVKNIGSWRDWNKLNAN